MSETAADQAPAADAGWRDTVAVMADGRRRQLNAEPARRADGSWELSTDGGPLKVQSPDLWLCESGYGSDGGFQPLSRPLPLSLVLPDESRIDGEVLGGKLEPDGVRLGWRRGTQPRTVHISTASVAALQIMLRPPEAAARPAGNGAARPTADVSHAIRGLAVIGDGRVVPSNYSPQQLSDRSWNVGVDGQSMLFAPGELWLVETSAPVTADFEPCGDGLGLTVFLPDGQSLQGQMLRLSFSPEGICLRWQRDEQERTLFIAQHAMAALVCIMRLPVPAAEVPEPGGDPTVPLLRSDADLDGYLAAHLRGRTAPIESHFLSSLQNWQELCGKSARTQHLFGVAHRLGLALVDLRRIGIAPSALAAVPAQLVRRTRLLPLRIRQGVMAVAADRPDDPEAQASIEFATGLRVLVLLAASSAIDAAIDRQVERVEDVALIRSLHLNEEGSLESGEQSRRESERLASEKPVVALVAGLISDAMRRRASDIHIRPRAEDFEILYRIDGAMIPVRTLPRPLLRAVVARIKVIGTMDIAEHRLPQDGRVSYEGAEGAVDLRISVLPSCYGESVVMRLLNPNGALRNIADMGFSSHDEEQFRDMLARSTGLLLVVGPTGCGKSTTLYAALMEIRKENVNIITVENPVEYHIPDVTQIQVQHDIGLDFARTLRNILRHDPDVIMIGEIRDHETAEIAVESALTGHVVLSTLHTNSAATAVTRLLDLGVEAFLLSSTLLGVLAQRLARRNCPNCMQPENVSAFIRATLGVGKDEVFQRGIGCAHCGGSGVHGRMAVYELLPVTPALRRLITPNADGDAIHAAALAEGMVPLTQHAVALARAGKISLAEAYRLRVG